MVDLGCQGTDWVGGNDRVLDAILLLDGLILATLSVTKGKCLKLSGYRLGRWK